MFNRLVTKLEHVLRFLPISLQLKALTKIGRFREDVMGPYVEAVLTNGYNGRLLVGASDLVVGRELAFAGSYDKAQLELLLSQIVSGSEVLVVGAHVGALLIPLARKAARVVGVEANPQTYQLLSMNVTLNALANVQLHNFAAGSVAGELDFLCNKHNTGGSKVVWHPLPPLFYYDAPTTSKVAVKRLDDELEGRGFDLIVMDIEGSEYFAFQGMQTILSRSRVLQMEVSRFSIDQVAQVTACELIAPLRAHFSVVAVPGVGGTARDLTFYAQEEWDALFERLVRSGDTYNVLLMKDVPADR